MVSAKAWKVLAHLSAIRADVEKLAYEELRHTAVSRGIVDAQNAELSVVWMLRELETCRRWCLHVEKLSRDEIAGYHAVKSFYHTKVFGYLSCQHNWQRRRDDALDKITFPWLWKQVLQDGPQIFWHFWWQCKDDQHRDPLPLKHKYEEKWKLAESAQIQSAQNSIDLLETTARETRDSRWRSYRDALPRGWNPHYHPPLIPVSERHYGPPEPKSATIFDGLLVEQHLDWRVFGEIGYLDSSEGEEACKQPVRRMHTCWLRHWPKQPPEVQEYQRLREHLGQRRDERLKHWDRVVLASEGFCVPEG